jgi:hypothetical protein
MYAYIGTNIQEPFNPANWVTIPFIVDSKANDVEYEFEGGGNPFDQDLNKDDNVEFGRVTIPYFGYVGVLDDTFSIVDNSDGAVVIASASDSHRWTFETGGDLRLPAGGDIVDSTGASVLGGNANTGNVVFDGNQMYVGGVGFLNFNDNSQQAVIGTNGSYPLKVSLNEGDKTWAFDPTGDFYMPDGGAIRFDYGYIDQDPDSDNDALRISGGNGVTIKADEDGQTWRFNNDGSITFPDDTVQTTAYTGQSGGSSTVARQDTAPSASNGTLWFNTVEGRLYIKYADAWVDAAPLVQPQPATDIDVESITFADATVQTTAYPGASNKIVNGDYEVVLDQDGVLNLPRRGAIRNLSGTYDVNVVGAGPNGFAQLQWTTLAGAAEDNPNGTNELLHWVYLEEPGVFIETNVNGEGESYEWQFKTDGSMLFPTLTVPISDNANPSGTGQALKFGDSTQQAIIYGPSATADNNGNAERVIIQGAPGYTGTSGEGGDVYLWAGPGGDANGNGGDIKIRAGRGDGTGEGGYLYFQTGSSETGYAGSIRLETGSSGTYGQGGPITLEARSGGQILLRTYNSEGNSRDLTFTNAGNLTLPGNITFPDNTVQTTAYPGITTVAKTGANLTANNVFFEVTAVDGSGVVTEITVTNSPNPTWTTQTSGNSLGDVNFTVSFDGSGNASVTVNSSGTGHSIGETFNLQPDAVGATAPSRIALDLTKSVNKLTEGSYSLADGVEGQIMYLVAQNGITDANNVSVLIANSRITGIAYTNAALLPFRWYNGDSVLDNSGMTTIIFTDGAWQQQGGYWDLV